MTYFEKETILDGETPEGPNPKSLIYSILKSNELSLLIDAKLSKYVSSYKKNIAVGIKNKGSLAKLEEGYESSDSDDSTKTTGTTLSSSTHNSGYSSAFSDISSLNSDAQSLYKENIEGDIFFKINREINELKTIIPEEKSHKSSIANSNNNNNIVKNTKIISSYPLEFFEIFPNLKKFEINNQLQDNIEKPIFFIKNLILKNYHESLSFTQNKLQLQMYKNSADYQYKIMNISQPINCPAKSDNITCMIVGLFKKNETDKKNMNIKNINNIIDKLGKTQNIKVNFIFFGYKNGLILQYVLLDIKADPLSLNSLPADNFFLYREYSVENLITEAKIDKHVLCMSLSEDENYLLAGYASGHIIIWKMVNGKNVFCFDDIFEMPVVSCEFVSIENNKTFLFLASDLIGKVRLIQYTKNTFIDNHNTIIISNCFYPCLLVKTLKFNNKEGKEDFDMNNIIKRINNHDSYICLMGNLEYIIIFYINKKSLYITNKLLVKNPDLNILNPMTEEIKKNRADFYSQKYLRDNLSKIEFPDASFGLGYLGDLITKNDNKEPYILFVISWKNEITLYYFNKNLSKIREIGWYLNNAYIIKIGFIGTSLIYFIDKNNNIKIINVKLFTKTIKKYKDDDDDEEDEDNNNFDFTNNDYKRIKNKHLIPLSDIITIENPIKTISKNFTETINYYNPFITNNKYNIYLIQDNDSNNNKINKNNIYHIHLLSYAEFFHETMKNLNWKLFFCKFIDMFKNNNNTFGEIPENKEMKENLIIDKKTKFVKNNCLGYYFEKNYLENEEEAEDLEIFENHDFLSVGIEFSIEIGSLDYIYNEIKKLKMQKEFKRDLVIQLEPFILNNKFQNNPNLISEELINEIINFYTCKEKEDELFPIMEEPENKLFKLDLILCHLNINIIKKIKTIEDIIQQNKLYCSIIYYYSNGLNDFITPLQYLFEEFKKSKYTQILKENINTYFKKGKLSRGFYRDNYTNLIKSLKSGNFNLENNLFITKDFIGHLLLSFIQLTLKGLFFPNIGKIPLKLYNSIIPDLFLFLTKKNIAMELISFDSFSYFETLTLFILREEEIKTLSNVDLNDSNFNFINENNKNKNDFCPLNINQIDFEKLKTNIDEYKNTDNNINNTNINKEDKEDKEDNLNINQNYLYELIYKIMELCENKKIFRNNLLIKFDLYLFIIKISLKLDNISVNILDKALISIFEFHNDIKNLKKSLDGNSFTQLFEKIDKYKCHFNIIKRKQSNLDELSSIINNLIKKYYINKNDINNNEVINKLLKMCSNSHFLGVKIFLYELKKEYIQCIRVFLNENRKISKRVFTFINKTLNLLKNNKDEKNLQLFKNEIKRIISNLAGVSSTETFRIIQNWFNSLDIISNLNNLPKLQFKYLDKIKTIYKRKLKNEKSIETRNDSTKKEYSEILLLYINLLFHFEREQRVLKLLKNEEEYINIRECLKICLNKSIDACVYLYKLIGDEKSALNICLKKMNNNYETIKNNKKNDLNSSLFDEIKKLIDESIKICEYNSENSTRNKKRNNSIISTNSKFSEDNDLYDMGKDFWLQLFDQIYKIINDTEQHTSLIFSKIKNYLSQKIEDLLIAMSYYVDFTFIFENMSNDLEFSLFKKFLNKIFYTKSHLSNLYNSYINLLSDNINKNMQIVEINEQEGKNVRLTVKEENENNLEKEKIILDRFNKYNFNYKYSRNKEINDINNYSKDNNKENVININKNLKIYKKCNLCSKMLNFIDYKYENENNDIIIFKCNHIYHMNCLLNEYNQIQKNLNDENFEDNYCPKCVNIETELFSFINNDNNITNINNINNENNNIENKNENNIINDKSEVDNGNKSGEKKIIQMKQEKRRKKIKLKIKISKN